MRFAESGRHRYSTGGSFWATLFAERPVVTLGENFVPTAGETFEILGGSDGLVGSFDEVILPMPVGGYV